MHYLIQTTQPSGGAIWTPAAVIEVISALTVAACAVIGAWHGIPPVMQKLLGPKKP